jgi:hypothetical protein
MRAPLIKIFHLTVLIIGLSGCASYYGAATIVSDPPGAQVINDDDGKVLGVTPLTTWWKSGDTSRQHIILDFTKDGYYKKISSFWLSMRHRTQGAAIDAPQVWEVTLEKKAE